MSKRNAGKGRAIITGASSGIGEAFARRLGKDGHSLTLVARRRAQLERIAKEIHQLHGVKVDVLAADLADAAELRKVEQHARDCADLAILVNNAGLGTATRFAESDIDRIEGEIRLNVIALVRLTRAALPGMVERGSGAVINVSSAAAFQPNPFFASYGATKAYVNSFTEAISDELRGTGVRLLAVCPGPVRTAFGATAGVDENKAPQFTFIEADVVVEDSLAALKSGDDVCVPGRLQRTIMAATGMLPRRVLRRVTYEVGRRFFE